MSFRSLLTQTVILVEPRTKKDAYNNDVPDWDDAARTTEPGLIQQSATVEDDIDRDTVRTDVTLFLLPTATISALYRVEEGDRRFEVIGDPDILRSRRGPHHIEAHLRSMVG